jgi:hypothetical protein
MKLTDLQWQIGYLLRNSSLSDDERVRIEREIVELINKFGTELVTNLGVMFNGDSEH